LIAKVVITPAAIAPSSQTDSGNRGVATPKNISDIVTEPLDHAKVANPVTIPNTNTSRIKGMTGPYSLRIHKF
jgi:hypothetical protein